MLDAIINFSFFIFAFWVLFIISHSFFLFFYVSCFFHFLLFCFSIFFLIFRVFHSFLSFSQFSIFSVFLGVAFLFPSFFLYISNIQHLYQGLTVSSVVGTPWRCGVLTTQGGKDGIGLGHQLGREHDSTPTLGLRLLA